MRVLNERALLVIDLREQGWKYKEIGGRIGVSSARAEQIYRHSVRLLTREPRFSDGLSARAANCLNNYNLNSREEVLAAFESGRLNPTKTGTRNYGWKTHKEVAKWLGLPAPQQPTPTPRVCASKACPHCGHRYIIKST